MNALKEIFIIIISVMIATSYSAALTIGMNREDKRNKGEFFYILIYKIWTHVLVIVISMFVLFNILIFF